MATRVFNVCPDLGLTRAQSNNTQSAMHCTYYWSSRIQQLYTSAMLTTLKIPKGATLKRFGWYIYSSGVYTSISSLRVAIGHTTATALTTTWLTSTLTYVIGTAAVGYTISMATIVTSAYNTWACTAFFTWNGTSNILIEMSRTGTAGAGTTTTGYWGQASGTYGNVIHRYAANSSTFPLTGAGGIGAAVIDLYMEWEYAQQGSHWIGISL